jgi:hypothetical protein
LGAFLVAVAGFFVYWGATFLGVVQLFVYIGGVLVLMIFAIMLVHRSPDGLARARDDGTMSPRSQSRAACSSWSLRRFSGTWFPTLSTRA